MTIIGVRFKKTGKIFYFDAKDMIFEVKEAVITETQKGLEYGIVEIIKNQEDFNSDHNIKKILRKATEDDIQLYNKIKEDEVKAKYIFIEKTKKHNILMNLIDVEITFDCNKIIFYFTAEGRVDFRELVKDLASVLKMRIELRQIGVRDEAKAINGVSICGRPLCCSTFLENFHSVSIKMAKDQNLSLNPSKISGVCGRLMCCLKYEQSSYEYLNKNLPREGDLVKSSTGQGEVLSVNVLRQIIKVAIIKDGQDSPVIELFSPADLEIVKKRFKKKRDDFVSPELKRALRRIED